MKQINLTAITTWYTKNREKKISGRHIILNDIEPIIKNLGQQFRVEKLGNSFLNKPIYTVEIGTGKTNILLWTQMHGNESTGTKALFDLFRFFDTSDKHQNLCNYILDNCKITCIPMLNPDGAEVYTRVNAQEIDLNRDALDQKAPESMLLQQILKEVNPDYCFNLHDQRTIFSVGDTKHTATLSFLAPSEEENRQLTDGRKETMRVISVINQLMQQVIPNKVGRYTDEFYPTATGDNFQKAGYNTVLFEAGHFKDDYDREEVRKFNFLAMLQGLNYIASSKKQEIDYNEYFKIPENTEFYLDVLYKNVLVKETNKRIDIGIIFKEQLINNKLHFIPEIKITGNLLGYDANYVVDNTDFYIKNDNDFDEILKNSHFL